jgi:hypothetical protein
MTTTTIILCFTITAALFTIYLLIENSRSLRSAIRQKNKQIEETGSRIIRETLWLRRVIESKSREIAALRRQIQPKDRLGRWAPKNRGSAADQICASAEKTAEDFIREMRPKLEASRPAQDLSFPPK